MYVICSAVAAASPLPKTLLAHCFETLGSDRRGGLLGCWVMVLSFLFRSIVLLRCVLARWILEGEIIQTFSISTAEDRDHFL